MKPHRTFGGHCRGDRWHHRTVHRFHRFSLGHAVNFETLRIGIGVVGIKFLPHDDVLGRRRLMRRVPQFLGNAVAIRRPVHLLGHRSCNSRLP